jgi:site-specific DNA-cytosine methylase
VKTVDAWGKEARYPLALDLFCGIGGLSFGLRQAGFQVAGLDIDPVAIDHYRRYVGPALVERVEDITITSRRADVVTADLPARNPKDHPWGVDPLLLEHVLRVAAGARFVVLVWYPRRHDGGKAEQHLVSALKVAGWRPKIMTLDAAHYGVPQHRHRVVAVGCATARLFHHFTFPKPTVDEYVTVRAALGIPYDAPSPDVRPGEWRSGWRGMQRGKSRPNRACEIMAEQVGRGRWGQKVALSPEQLAVLQGLPAEWHWPYSMRASTELIGRAFPPPMARALGRRLVLALKRDGLVFASTPLV